MRSWSYPSLPKGKTEAPAVHPPMEYHPHQRRRRFAKLPGRNASRWHFFVNPRQHARRVAHRLMIEGIFRSETRKHHFGITKERVFTIVINARPGSR
jgi:hypothetical protein